MKTRPHFEYETRMNAAMNYAKKVRSSEATMPACPVCGGAECLEVPGSVSGHYTHWCRTCLRYFTPESKAKCAECERLVVQLAEAQKERDAVLKSISEIELIPGQVAVPFFKTDDEYKAFREWWTQNVTVALAQHGKLR